MELIFSHEKGRQEVKKKSYIIHNMSGRVLIIEYSLIDDSLATNWALYSKHNKLIINITC